MSMIPPVPPHPADPIVRHAELLLGLGRYPDVIALSGAWLAGAPDTPALRLIEAHALRESGNLDGALASYRAVLAADPGHVAARSGVALTLFAKGDFDAAFAAFDVRFDLMDQPPRVRRRGRDGRQIDVPRWLGGPAPGTLLVLAEQGLGDTLQFARYLPALAARVETLIIVVQPRLMTLLRPLAPRAQWRSLEQGGTVPANSGWLAMMDIPRALGLSVADYAAPGITFTPPEAARRRMAELPATGRLRIGVVWQGNPDPRIDGGRSMPAEALLPLADIPGAELVSLQHGVTEEPPALAGRLTLVPGGLDTGPDGFLETAALIERLDCVVSVDTATAHLAAAMGKPVHLCLKAPGADWRWAADPVTSVWYPSVRLARQQRPGDWSGVIAEIVDRLRPSHGTGEPRQPAQAGARLIPAVLGTGTFFAHLADVSARYALATTDSDRHRLLAEKRGLQGAWHRMGLDAGPLREMISALADLARRLALADATLAALDAAGRYDDAFIAASRARLLLAAERERLVAAIDTTGTTRSAGAPALDEVA